MKSKKRETIKNKFSPVCCLLYSWETSSQPKFGPSTSSIAFHVLQSARVRREGGGSHRSDTKCVLHGMGINSQSSSLLNWYLLEAKTTKKTKRDQQNTFFSASSTAGRLLWLEPQFRLARLRFVRSPRTNSLPSIMIFVRAARPHSEAFRLTSHTKNCLQTTQQDSSYFQLPKSVINCTTQTHALQPCTLRTHTTRTNDERSA